MRDVIRIRELILAAVAGDVGAVPQLAELDHRHLLEAVETEVPLMLARDGVLRVLRDYENRLFTGIELQRWAWFVSRGYIPELAGGPVLPIDIQYEPSDEDGIAVAVARISELGDAVDGAIDTAELAALRSRLISTSP